jgi:outer membrane protein assembly factor BamE (lipoprotein component of BamABCDE complex)
MKKILLLVMVLVLLVSGCAEFPLPGVTSQSTINSFETIKANINSCNGKITKDQLVMHAGSPTERVSVDNGEIWIYNYQESERVDADPMGLFGKMGQSASYDRKFAFSVRLNFDRNGVLNGWSFTGHYEHFNHPFKTLRCQ